MMWYLIQLGWTQEVPPVVAELYPTIVGEPVFDLEPPEEPPPVLSEPSAVGGQVIDVIRQGETVASDLTPELLDNVTGFAGGLVSDTVSSAGEVVSAITPDGIEESAVKLGDRLLTTLSGVFDGVREVAPNVVRAPVNDVAVGATTVVTAVADGLNLSLPGEAAAAALAEQQARYAAELARYQAYTFVAQNLPDQDGRVVIDAGAALVVPGRAAPESRAPAPGAGARISVAEVGAGLDNVELEATVNALRSAVIAGARRDGEKLAALDTGGNNERAATDDDTRPADDVVAVGSARGWDCTGVLLAPDIVLTAAHCRDTEAVLFGARVDRPIGVYPVRRRLDHPDGIDAAILVLFGTVSARPRPWWGGGTPDELLAVGFGLVAADMDGAGIKHDIELTGSSWGCTASASARWGCDPASELVLRSPTGADTCDGDSGGPLFARQSGGEWQLVGLVSRSVDHARRRCGEGGVYVRLDNIQAWVVDVIQQNSVFFQGGAK